MQRTAAKTVLVTGSAHSSARVVSHAHEAKRIRVALIQPSLPHYRVPVYREIAARSSVDLTVHYSSRHDIRNAEPEGFRAVYSPSTLDWRRSTLVWQQEDIRVAGSGEYDVVILPWTPRQLSLLPAISAARRVGTRVVLWGQGVSKFESVAKLNLRMWLARRADTIVTYNQAVASNMVKLGFAQEDVFAAINSLDQSEIGLLREQWGRATAEMKQFREAQRLKNNTILFVSRLHYPNRIDVLIEAAARMLPQMPDLRVILVGAGEARESLDAQVKRLGLESVVTFTGAVYSEERCAPWFCASDVFCYPSNAGLSLLHAQGYGLPLVVGNRLSAHNPEIESFQDGVNGRSFSHNDAADLARVLTQMLRDRDELRQMGEAGIRNVSEYFTISRMVDGLEKAVIRAFEKSRQV